MLNSSISICESSPLYSRIVESCPLPPGLLRIIVNFVDPFFKTETPATQRNWLAHVFMNSTKQQKAVSHINALLKEERLIYSDCFFLSHNLRFCKLHRGHSQTQVLVTKQKQGMQFPPMTALFSAHLSQDRSTMVLLGTLAGTLRPRLITKKFGENISKSVVLNHLPFQEDAKVYQRQDSILVFQNIGHRDILFLQLKIEGSKALVQKQETLNAYADIDKCVFDEQTGKLYFPKHSDLSDEIWAYDSSTGECAPLNLKFDVVCSMDIEGQTLGVIHFERSSSQYFVSIYALASLDAPLWKTELGLRGPLSLKIKLSNDKIFIYNDTAKILYQFSLA